MTDLNEIVELLTDPVFIQDHWMQKPKVFQAAELFESVRTGHSLETLIKAAAKVMPDSIHIIEKRLSHTLTRGIDLSKCDDPEQTVLNIAQHRTLILYDFHILHRFYHELALQLDEKFWGDTTAGMFVSLKKRSGFKKHRDRNHIFVFQHSGSTIWKVYDFMHEQKLILKHELLPGEILYVPIFFGHSAQRVGVRESHVSVGISYDRKRNFYEALCENPLLAQACEPEARQQLLKSREIEKQRNLTANIQADPNFRSPDPA